MASVGTQTKSRRFSGNYFKNFVRKFSLDKTRSSSSSTIHFLPNQCEMSIMSRSSFTPITSTTSTDTTDDLELEKKGDLLKYLQKIFMIKSGKSKSSQKVSSEDDVTVLEIKEKETLDEGVTVEQKVIENEPINELVASPSYQCCLDVSCVDPPPIIPMNFFKLLRDTRKKKVTPKIQVVASQSDVDNAKLFLFAMETK